MNPACYWAIAIITYLYIIWSRIFNKISNTKKIDRIPPPLPPEQLQTWLTLLYKFEYWMGSPAKHAFKNVTIYKTDDLQSKEIWKRLWWSLGVYAWFGHLLVRITIEIWLGMHPSTFSLSDNYSVKPFKNEITVHLGKGFNLQISWDEGILGSL